MLEKEIEERTRGGSGRRVREEKMVLEKGRAGQGGEGSEREREDLEKEWEK